MSLIQCNWLSTVLLMFASILNTCLCYEDEISTTNPCVNLLQFVEHSMLIYDLKREEVKYYYNTIEQCMYVCISCVIDLNTFNHGY